MSRLAGGAFNPPKRPNHGTTGRQISLSANFLPVTLPEGNIHHYDVSICPDKCPRRVNRDVVEMMVKSYHQVFQDLKPVFDGRKNIYCRKALPIGKRPVS